MKNDHIMPLKHRYVGYLDNAIGLEIEVLICGKCDCWFVIDSGAIECPYLPVFCSVCGHCAEIANIDAVLDNEAENGRIYITSLDDINSAVLRGGGKNEPRTSGTGI